MLRIFPLKQSLQIDFSHFSQNVEVFLKEGFPLAFFLYQQNTQHFLVAYLHFGKCFPSIEDHSLAMVAVRWKGEYFQSILCQAKVVSFREWGSAEINYHRVKSVQIRSFSWSVFSRIFPTLYSVRMRENTDQKKLHIWTIFTLCIACVLLTKIWIYIMKYCHTIDYCKFKQSEKYFSHHFFPTFSHQFLQLKGFDDRNWYEMPTPFICLLYSEMISGLLIST